MVHNTFNSLSKSKGHKKFHLSMYHVSIPPLLAWLMNLIDDPFLFSFGIGLWQFLGYELVHTVS